MNLTRKAERAMLDAREERRDYGSSKSYKRKFTRFLKRQLRRATRRLERARASARP